MLPSLSGLHRVFTSPSSFFDLDPRRPVTTPIVQKSAAFRIVLACGFARSDAFARFFLAFVQDVLNDFNIYMCAKHVVEFLL